jgi:hypothetical protein
MYVLHLYFLQEIITYYFAVHSELCMYFIAVKDDLDNIVKVRKYIYRSESETKRNDHSFRAMAGEFCRK